MSVDHIYRCDGPGCNGHVQSCDPAPRTGFLRVMVGENQAPPTLFDFCGWECVMRFGATMPIPEVIEWTGPSPETA